jgi:hypothetical protein
VRCEDWEAILDSALELGIDTVGTYVPWEFHETGEGVYDFALLEEFLGLVEKKGLKVLARPGPYIYAEWRNLGVPDHAAPFHKLHPEFRRKASHWIAAVMKVLAPRLGRLVVAVQADNEIDPMLHVYGEDLGFAAWLRERYGTIERLNAAWGGEYGDFAEAMPALAPFEDSRAFRDSARYRYDLAARYARWVVGEYRRNGCNVPILLNTWPGVDAQNWADFQEEADLFGIDIYPTSECRGDFRLFRERLRLLRAVAGTPYISEFGSGHWREPGEKERTYTADHYRLTAWTALASGVRGWNWYMLANRDSWTGAPIDERGVLDPDLKGAFAEGVRAFRSLEGAGPPEVSCGSAWSWPDRQAAEIKRLCSGRPFIDAVHGMDDAGDDPLGRALFETGIEYDFVDVNRMGGAAVDSSGSGTAATRPVAGAAGRPLPPILFCDGEVEDPEPLWRYAEAGGNLVFFQRLPSGLRRPDGTSHPFARHLDVSLGFEAQGPVLSFRRVPGTPVTATQKTWDVDENGRLHMEAAAGRTYTTGYHERRGAGSILVVGCAPSADAIVAVHRFLGVTIPVRPLTPGIHASKRGDRIVVVNPGEALTARLDVRGAVLSVDLPRCSGAALRKDPAAARWLT